MEMKIRINNQIVNFEFYQTSVRGNIRPILVFLHGWQRSLRDFEVIAQELNKSDWPILLVDLPGFGGSSLPNFGWHIENYVDFLKAFLEQFRISFRNFGNTISENRKFLASGFSTSSIIIGHSFGGRVAIKFASKYPDKVKKLVLIASGGIRHKTFKSIALKYFAKIVKNFLKIFRLSRLSEHLREKFSSPDYLQASGIMKEVFLNSISEDLTNDAKKIQAPTLIIWGEDDEELPVQDAFILQKTIKQSRVEIFDRAGHFMFLEKQQDFLKILTEFI